MKDQNYKEAVASEWKEIRAMDEKKSQTTTYGVHDSRLQCRVLSLEYNFECHTGHIFFPPGNCCDMEGCINFFKNIDKEVNCIMTFAGGERDTSYWRKNNEWVAR
jgi:hypothetical protein